MTNQIDWGFEDVERDLLHFAGLLERVCGRQVPPNSTFEELALVLMEINAARKGETTIDLAFNYRDKWRRAIGLADLIRKAVVVEAHPDFPRLCPHFQLLLGGSSIVQNAPSAATDQAASKLFELLVALSMMRLASSVELDHPLRSSGSNPDVIATIDGVTWGIACKTPHTANPKTYLDNLQTAIKQIDRSPAEFGLVFVNLRNLIDHDALWRTRVSKGSVIYDAYANEGTAEQALLEQGEHLSHDVAKELGGPGQAAALFAASKAVPIVINYLATLVGVVRNGKPYLTIMRRLLAWPFVPDESHANLLERVNQALLGP